MPTIQQLTNVFTSFATDEPLRLDAEAAMKWAQQKAGVALTADEVNAFVFRHGENYACVGRSCPPKTGPLPTVPSGSRDRVEKVFQHLINDRMLFTHAARALTWSANMYSAQLSPDNASGFEIAVNFDEGSGYDPLSHCVGTSCQL